MPKIYLILLLALYAGQGVAQENGDEPYVAVPESTLMFDGDRRELKRFNPLTAVSLSTLIPGAGLLYTEKPIQAATFLGAEIVAALVVANRAFIYELEDDQVDFRRQELREEEKRFDEAEMDPETDSSVLDVLSQEVRSAQIELELARYDRREDRYGLYHGIGWLSGIHLFNIAAALRATNIAQDVQPRKPAVAGWLSSIPALGLGQIYNGSYAKAGMVFMGQSMLGWMAYNNDRLMQSALDERSEVAEGFTTARDAWLRRYDEAARRRNLYLWYSIFFYFYGVLDAVVDAHLHDYDMQMRFEPKVDAGGADMGLRLSIGGEF